MLPDSYSPPFPSPFSRPFPPFASPSPLMIRLPYFSRSQLGVILLLGAALLLLYAWRAHVLFPPSPPPPGTLSLAFVEVTGKVAHPGVYSFPRPPSLKEVWAKAGAVGTPPDPDKTIASGSRVEVTPDGGYRLAAMPGAQLLTLGLPTRSQPGHRRGPGRHPRPRPGPGAADCRLPQGPRAV